MRTQILATALALLSTACSGNLGVGDATTSGGTADHATSSGASGTGTSGVGTNGGSSNGSTSSGSGSGSGSSTGGTGPTGDAGCGSPVPTLNACTPAGVCLPCGQPGQACCQSGSTCDCQDYGRELCLGSFTSGQPGDGRPGDPCLTDGGCATGTTCLPFGPGSICQECGGPGEPCCAQNGCQSGLSCDTGCVNSGGNPIGLCLPSGTGGSTGGCGSCPSGMVCQYSCAGGISQCVNTACSQTQTLSGCACLYAIQDAGTGPCPAAGLASCGQDGGLTTFECVEGC
ncbi:MAG: hypothetical protein ACYDCL_14455 [Myxococcales bacterium]